MSMTTKLGRVVSYYEGLLLTKSHRVNSWSRGLARSRDKLKPLSPLTQCLWPPY